MPQVSTRSGPPGDRRGDESGHVALRLPGDESALMDVPAVTIGPLSDCPFPVTTVALHPTDFERVKRGELALPEGWDLNQALQVWPRPPMRRP